MPSTGSRITKTIERLRDAMQPDQLRQQLGRIGPVLTVAARLLRRVPLLGRLRRYSWAWSSGGAAKQGHTIELPGVSLPARPGLLLLTTLLLSLLCLVLIIPARSPIPARAEFVLLSDASSSNLNDNTSAEAGTPQAVVEPSSPDATGTGLPPAPAEDALPVSPPAPVLKPALEPCYPIRDPHRGETPMLRTWKMLGLKTLLAALFTAAPALGSNTSGPPSDTEKLDEIQKQLNGLRTAVAEVKKTLDALSAQEEGKKTEANLGAQKVLSRFADLEKQISDLRADVEKLRNVPPPSTRSSAFGPAETATPLSTGMARVEMINSYGQPVSIVINNQRAYLLQPGERRLSDPIPAGTFTYEVLGVTPLVTRTVGADKLFTIWVHNQP
jgi:hypothetical protein